MFKTNRLAIPLATLAIIAATNAPLVAQSREDATVSNAAAVLDEVMQTPGRAIPRSLLVKAKGVVIIPNMIKGGFIIGARHGKGVALVRNEQDSWDAPRLLQMSGGSVGFQAGVQSTDVVLLFMTKKSVEGLLQGKLTIGADAAVAAGPVGRQLAAATDERFRAEILSYARSRGLFAGVSLDGSSIRPDPAAEAYYYRLSEDGKSTLIPESAGKLIQKVAAYSGSTPVIVGPSTKIQKIDKKESTRKQLAQASVTLHRVLPKDWQRYLALPAEVHGSDKHPSAEILKETLSRFDKVAGTPAYRVLAEKPGFQQTHTLLREYLSVLEPKVPQKLQLPPAPVE